MAEDPAYARSCISYCTHERRLQSLSRGRLSI